jgi:hypothetical protein
MAIKINGTEVIDDSRNITNVGTVDGRDVSVDGSKLDNIESNADVTDIENVGSALTGFTTETSIAETDLIPVYDASESSWRKATVSDAALVGAKGQKGEVGAAGTNGQNGAKGQKGQTGITGAKGQKGEIGDQGIQGDVGSKGQKGELGSTGETGLTGNDGAKGQKGEVGSQGLVGAKGEKGQAGSDGTNGSNGDTGLTGDTGQKGHKGEVGLTGDTGSKGQKGEIGAKGQKGEIGAAGQKGEAGSQGIQGIQGIQGVKGQKGEIGGTGLTGDGGAKGQKGETGGAGGTGLQGQKGQKGETGNTGGTGTSGAKGEKGQKGEVGADGLTGAKGEKGQAGSNGTNGAKGQKGEIGATGGVGGPGATGAKGEKGQKGEIGGTGNTGGTGAKGQKGEPGQTGGTGGTGQKGEKGQKGDNGAAGGTGQKGEKGQKGEIGATGGTGGAGAAGQKGEKGQKGQTGATGTTGGTGTTGAAGQKGQKGDNGITGATGLIDNPYGAISAYGSATTSLTWSTAEQALDIYHATDASSGCAFPAFRVNLSSGETHKLSIKYKSNGSYTSGFYVRVYEYNAALPNGKLAVSNSAVNSLVQEDSQGFSNWKENQPINTTWQTTDYTYTPTAGAVWASIVVLNWDGIGTNHVYIRDPEHQLIPSSNADLLDGYNSSQSESSNTVAVRNASGYLFSNYFNGSGTFSTTGLTSGMARFTGTNGTDTYGRSYTAAAARTLLNVADGANNYSLPASPSVTSLYVADYIYHTGDINTYLQFPGTTGEMRFVSNGFEAQKWGRSGSTTYTQFGDSVDVRLGDGGDFEMKFNGTDTYFINRAHVGGDVIFMGEGSDGVNETAIRIDFSSAASSVALHYDNSQKLITTATGVTVSGAISYTNATMNDYIYHNGDTDTYMGFHAVDQWSVVTGGTQRLKVTNDTMTVAATLDMNGHTLDMNNNNIVGVGQIIHEGDTDTYMQFHAADEWRVVTGGTERLEVNNTQITSAEPIHAPSFHGDGSSLTGIASGANNDIFWENGQNVTSNYTITDGKNAMSAGPITINSGVTVTVGAGETWTVI